MKIVMIAAVGKDNQIGKDNKLLWALKDDMKHFVDSTTGKTVIMGRKTFESMGCSPLKNRINIVITRQNIQVKDVNIVDSVEKALSLAKTFEKDIYVIGGQEVYTHFMKYATHLSISHVDSDKEADTFFPLIDHSEWEVVSWRDFSENERNRCSFIIMEYKRK